MLKFKTETVHIIEDNVLDRFVQEHYDKNYSFVAWQELGNDSWWSCNVDGEIRDYQKKDVEKIRKGEVPYFGTRLLLNVLHIDGHIPAGKYMIKVSW